MKYIFLVIFFFYSITSYAEINPLEKLYIERLQSGSYPELKVTAKIMQTSDVRNTETLDIAAEILLQTYATASVAELEPAALLARVLGQSKNRRYYSVLKEVYENTTSKKLDKHVSIALKQLKKAEGEQYTKGMVTLAQPKPPTEAEKSLIAMLKSGDDKQIQNVAKYIIYSNIYHHDIFDAAAEALSKNHPKTNEEDSTSAELLVRVISYSYNIKYQKILTDISKSTKNDKLRSLSKKSIRHVKTVTDK